MIILRPILFPGQSFGFDSRRVWRGLVGWLFSKSGRERADRRHPLQALHGQQAADAAHPQGDQLLFQQVFDEKFPALLLYAKKLTGDLEAAKDILQEVFQNFWLKWQDLGSMENINGYLWVSVRNKCYDYLRFVASHERAERNYYNYHLPADEPTGDISKIEAETTAVQAMMALKKALDKLSGLHRQVLELHFYQGYSITEIAAQLHKNPNAVANLKLRALDKLRKQYHIS